LAVVAGVAVLLGVVVPLGGDQVDPVRPLPDPPPTSRSDVRFTVDATRSDGALRISFTLGVDREADTPLFVTDWSGGAGGDLWSAEGGSRSVVLGAHGERLADGQVVIHLGRAPLLPSEDVEYYEPPSSEALEVAPGREVTGRAALDPERAPPPTPDGAVAGAGDVQRAEEVRVCVWAAPADRSVRQAGGHHRPVACAEDEL
jgi:hypothetical protein